jgi:hypothetical protein
MSWDEHSSASDLHWQDRRTSNPLGCRVPALLLVGLIVGVVVLVYCLAHGPSRRPRIVPQRPERLAPPVGRVAWTSRIISFC